MPLKPKEKMKEYQKLWRRKLQIKNPKYVLFIKAKTRAKRLGLPFNLEISDIVIADKCPVLDIPLFRGTKNSCNNSPTLDKINQDLGYIKGNVCVISNRANRLKSNATLEELERLVCYIRQFRLRE